MSSFRKRCDKNKKVTISEVISEIPPTSSLILLSLSWFYPQFRRDVNASELVKGLPDSLLSSLSLSTLEKANLSSVDQLQGRGWTRAQVYTLDSNIKIQIHYHSTHFSLISLFLSVVSFPSEEDFG